MTTTLDLSGSRPCALQILPRKLRSMMRYGFKGQNFQKSGSPLGVAWPAPSCLAVPSRSRSGTDGHLRPHGIYFLFSLLLGRAARLRICYIRCLRLLIGRRYSSKGARNQTTCRSRI